MNFSEAELARSLGVALVTAREALVAPLAPRWASRLFTRPPGLALFRHCASGWGGD